jgi:hypothetical protein
VSSPSVLALPIAVLVSRQLIEQVSSCVRRGPTGTDGQGRPTDPFRYVWWEEPCQARRATPTCGG